ncbi:MAG: sigma-70 family RNA polymerase sigma factor [Actinomycetota bacterium]|nr:sigma-70 family RNA polymerase sigma factor [Actinomycetota bacterium]
MPTDLPTDSPSLTALVEAAAAGDQQAWDALVERFSRLLWSVGRSFRLAEDDAADVVQTTWLKLLENLGRIQEPEALPGWLATTARREALRVVQRRGHDVLVRDEDLGVGLVDHQASELDLALLASERDAALWSGFTQLSERCQQLLRVLMACDRPAYVEVADSLSMPIGSIGPTRMRCLGRLEKILATSSYAFGPQPGGVA